jgi:hypothetical protein
VKSDSAVASDLQILVSVVRSSNGDGTLTQLAQLIEESVRDMIIGIRLPPPEELFPWRRVRVVLCLCLGRAHEP